MNISLNKLSAIADSHEPVRNFVHWFTSNSRTTQVPMQAVINKMEYTDAYLVLKALGDVDLTRRFMARSLTMFMYITKQQIIVNSALQTAINHANLVTPIKSQQELDKQYRIIQALAKSTINEKASSIDEWYFLRAVKSTMVRDDEYDHGHNAVILLSKITKGNSIKKLQKQLFIETFVKTP